MPDSQNWELTLNEIRKIPWRKAWQLQYVTNVLLARRVGRPSSRSAPDNLKIIKMMPFIKEEATMKTNILEATSSARL